MDWRLPFEILAQPDDTTCGPTCLHAVYQFYGESPALPDLIAQIPHWEEGGTLAVFLGCHALGRGYRATIYTYNLSMFDPTWFATGHADIAAKLRAQREIKHDVRLDWATEGYLEFLALGGRLRMRDLTAGLIGGILERERPILTGLSSTYLYREPREYGPQNLADDVRGLPTGHFVVLCGYNRSTREVMVADPMHPNPLTSKQHIYSVPIQRVINAILLGVLTYDANMLVIEPPPAAAGLREAARP